MQGRNKIVVTLSFDELNQIDKLDFSDNKELKEAQKAILIGCRTGLRFSDFNKLNDSNLKESNKGFKYWEFKTNKTKKWVQITLTDELKYLIGKFGKPNINFRENDDIKLNQKIKQVCRKAGITNQIEGELSISEKKDDGTFVRRDVRGIYSKYKLITTRTFRRSFATNYYGNIDTTLIMRVTGHTTEKMLREYINVNDERTVALSFNNINEFDKKNKK